VRFTVPTIKERGQLARTMGLVHQRKPQHGEASGTVTCQRCSGTVRFTILANGISRGQCVNACGVRWCQ
jgi:hypothetical protein